MLMDAALNAVVSAARGTAFEGDLFLVGGAVRDELLGRPGGSDLDLVTRGSSAELAQLLFDSGASSIPPVTYARFGTAMVRVKGVDIEIVTARRESYSEDSRKPTVEPASYLEDAQRRDFTVNTLMRDVFSDTVVDPLGSGLEDLQHRVLRTPLDPAATFYDDPLRMLRAVRFRWKLGFEPAAGLWDAVKAEALRLRIVSAERIRDEWLKMLALPTASRALQDLMDLGLLDQFVPELRAMIGCEQGRFHHKDVWDHTLLVVDKVDHSNPLLVLGALFHDVGKPETRAVDGNGNTRFFTHEVVGAAMTRRILRRLKFSEHDIEIVAKLVKNHMRLGSATEFSAAAARRLIRDLGAELEPLMELIEADAGSLRPGVRALDLGLVKEQIADALAVVPERGFESPISGQRIMELCGLTPGPEVGRIKDAVTEAVLDGRFGADDVAAAEAYAVEISRMPTVQ